MDRGRDGIQNYSAGAFSASSSSRLHSAIAASKAATTRAWGCHPAWLSFHVPIAARTAVESDSSRDRPCIASATSRWAKRNSSSGLNSASVVARPKNALLRAPLAQYLYRPLIARVTKAPVVQPLRDQIAGDL